MKSEAVPEAHKIVKDPEGIPEIPPSPEVSPAPISNENSTAVAEGEEGASA